VVVLTNVVVKNQGNVRVLVTGNLCNTCNIFSNILYVRELANTRLLSVLSNVSPCLEKSGS